LATCSSDQFIKIWDLTEQSEWKLTYQWKAHRATIFKVKWAHPEFGQILASCSADRIVGLWEETEGPNGSKKWICIATLFESHRPVIDIKFAPRDVGLKLAAASQEGIVRIYEPVDITNLGQWPAVESINLQKEGISCISWNPNPFDKPALAIGINNQVVIYEYDVRTWNNIGTISGSTESLIHDVAWAPNMGRTSHLIATANKNQKVTLWQLPMDSENIQAKEILLSQNEFPNEVWRVEWNATGTILAASGDGGILRFWKTNFGGEWQKIFEVLTEKTSNKV